MACAAWSSLSRKTMLGRRAVMSRPRRGGGRRRQPGGGGSGAGRGGWGGVGGSLEGGDVGGPPGGVAHVGLAPPATSVDQLAQDVGVPGVLRHLGHAADEQ